MDLILRAGNQTLALFAAREGQEKELEELQKFAESKGFEDNLSFFDVPYYTQLQRASMIG